MTTPFLVTKSPKSIGIAILLTFLFGPIGLFYASVSRRLIMTFTPVFVGLFLIVCLSQNNSVLMGLSFGLLITFSLTYWLINIIWAVISVSSYNKGIQEDVQRQFELWNSLQRNYKNQFVININQKSQGINITGQGATVSTKPNIQDWLKNNPGKTLNDYFIKFGR